MKRNVKVGIDKPHYVWRNGKWIEDCIFYLMGGDKLSPYAGDYFEFFREHYSKDSQLMKAN